MLTSAFRLAGCGDRPILDEIFAQDHQLKLAHNELHWHPVNEISGLAFDHDRILQTCLERLRDQIQEHPIVFNLLPEKFSLRELQALYEAILNTKMDRRNFRKKFFLIGRASGFTA